MTVTLDSSAESSLQINPMPEDARKAIAYRRWLAKTIDNMVFLFPTLLVVAICIAMTSSNLLRLLWALVGIVTLPSIFDAFCISRFSTTPGKTLVRLRLTAENGQRLQLRAALQRSFASALFGQGLNIPLWNMIAMGNAFVSFQSNGYVSWDRGTLWQAPPLSRTRKVMLGTLSVLYVLMMAAMSASSWMQTAHHHVGAFVQ